MHQPPTASPGPHPFPQETADKKPTQRTSSWNPYSVLAGPVEPDGVELHDGNLAGYADWIVTRHNDRRLSMHGGRDWVKNGDAWGVEQRHPDGSLTVVSKTHHGRVRLPAAYVAQYVELLYATTTHRAEGATVDTAHPVITAGMSRENLYVLASRARERTTFYITTHDLPFDDDNHTDLARTDPHAYAAREVLLNIIANEAAPLSATETIVIAQQEAGSLATLVPRYVYVADRDAQRRYARAAITALGGRPGADLQADPAWPAVVRRLREAESAGLDPSHLLSVVADHRELGSADSVAEVLTWRLDGYLAAHSRPEPTPVREAVLPWVGPPPESPESADVGRYFNEANALIAARVDELASIAVRHRPPWTLPLGQVPADPDLERQWLRHVAIIAAYREQFKVTTDDPRQILGPYAEPGSAAHKPYWRAAESVVEARRLAGLDSAAHAIASARLATGVYHRLGDDERLAVSRDMAARLGSLWFGSRTVPDEDAATQPVHAAALTRVLIERGHMTVPPERTGWTPEVDEPVEARLGRRGLTRPVRHADSREPGERRTKNMEIPLRPSPETPKIPGHRIS